ncbi:Uncharacterized protein, PA2063/DUF2235 family [Litoreibacter albidus]|uniref:Uncharacterized protein, PA2063/DUF2235 family n=2 Tax=Litoreibacter albidus TaxID=670155 RepID=A0A1H2RF69_9RHOB|nr:Uncharacterized protein, PA2063/DUF2235 family [Litoreibacter albidus]
MRWYKGLERLGGYIRPMSNRLKSLVGFGPAPRSVHPKGTRGPVTHVIILDGTMSTLERGYETHAGTTFRLLSEMAPNKAVSLKYEAGIQWQGLRRAIDVMAGVGINRQIRNAYGFIASRYRPGDRIFLFGYSRGAYAVRSLAGVIDQIGLLRADCATERNVRQAYRHYRRSPSSDASKAFRKQFCHADATIEMIGIWDTVRALGFRAPFLWRFSPVEHEFHSHSLGCSVKHGYHALALNETRRVFEPVLWQSREGYEGVLEQVWFKGAHGDIGGHLMGYDAARPLANIPLVWMLEKAEDCGLPLPDGWRARFPRDVDAPSVGTWRQWGKLFWQRRARVVGRDPSERLHPSVVNSPQGFVPASKAQIKASGPP